MNDSDSHLKENCVLLLMETRFFFLMRQKESTKMMVYLLLPKVKKNSSKKISVKKKILSFLDGEDEKQGQEKRSREENEGKILKNIILI